MTLRDMLGDMADWEADLSGRISELVAGIPPVHSGRVLTQSERLLAVITVSARLLREDPEPAVEEEVKAITHEIVKQCLILHLLTIATKAEREGGQ